MTNVYCECDEHHHIFAHDVREIIVSGFSIFGVQCNLFNLSVFEKSLPVIQEFLIMKYVYLLMMSHLS